jgi:hypothetical protein
MDSYAQVVSTPAKNVASSTMGMETSPAIPLQSSTNSPQAENKISPSSAKSATFLMYEDSADTPICYALPPGPLSACLSRRIAALKLRAFVKYEDSADDPNYYASGPSPQSACLSRRMVRMGNISTECLEMLLLLLQEISQ